MAHRKEKERNAERSRTAILRAAERLFATQGYEATSLNDVGAAAGVSRGTPGYFFGSKPELYQAVLDHSFNEVREAVRAGRARALASSQSHEIGRASLGKECRSRWYPDRRRKKADTGSCNHRPWK